MKITYDREVDILSIRLTDEPTSETDELEPGLHVDRNEKGDVVGIEVLNAGKHIDAGRT